MFPNKKYCKKLQILKKICVLVRKENLRNVLLLTLCCISLGRCCFGLETRVIIKISKNPSKYPINVTSFHWDEAKKKKKKIEKKVQNGRLKKTMFCQTVNSQYFFTKLSGMRPWVRKSDWCEGHWYGSTYMAVRLSDISSKMA